MFHVFDRTSDQVSFLMQWHSFVVPLYVAEVQFCVTRLVKCCSVSHSNEKPKGSRMTTAQYSPLPMTLFSMAK